MVDKRIYIILLQSNAFEPNTSKTQFDSAPSFFFPIMVTFFYWNKYWIEVYIYEYVLMVYIELTTSISIIDSVY